VHLRRVQNPRDPLAGRQTPLPSSIATRVLTLSMCAPSTTALDGSRPGIRATRFGKGGGEDVCVPVEGRPLDARQVFPAFDAGGSQILELDGHRRWNRAALNAAEAPPSPAKVPWLSPCSFENCVVPRCTECPRLARVGQAI